MTKTLTEQWREGTLPEGEYFAITTWSDEIRPLSFYGDCFLDTEVPLDNSVIVEVLAPVPSYDEYKDLYDSNKQLMAHIKTCEQQIERLQEQLKEANEIIQTLHKRKECDAFDHLIFGKYLEKWGLL